MVLRRERVARPERALHGDQPELNTDVRLDDAVVNAARKAQPFTMGGAGGELIEQANVLDDQHAVPDHLSHEPGVGCAKRLSSGEVEPAMPVLPRIDGHAEPRPPSESRQQRFDRSSMGRHLVVGRTTILPQLFGPQACGHRPPPKRRPHIDGDSVLRHREQRLLELRGEDLFVKCAG